MIKKISKKGIAAVSALVIAAAAAVTAYAYLGAKTEPKVNTMVIGENEALVSEPDFSEPTTQSLSDEIAKTVFVVNDGTTDCFVRVYLELSDSRLLDREVKISADADAEDDDFKTWSEFQSSPPAGWEFVRDEGNALDGYFYYTEKVPPGGATSALISKVKTDFGDKVEDISNFDMIVYSETVQTVEITPDGTDKVYDDDEWKDAWKSFLKIS